MEYRHLPSLVGYLSFGTSKGPRCLTGCAASIGAAPNLVLVSPGLVLEVTRRSSHLAASLRGRCRFGYPQNIQKGGDRTGSERSPWNAVRPLLKGSYLRLEAEYSPALVL